MAQQNQNLKGRSAFISLPSSFPKAWVGELYKYANNLNLGLVPYIYHGIPITPNPQISNIEFEARTDIDSVKYVFAAMAVKDTGEVDGVWIIKYIPRLLEHEIEFDLGFVEAAKNAAHIRTTYLPFLPMDVGFEWYRTPDEWFTYLKKELEKRVISK